MSALPLQMGIEISRELRGCGCRDFFFNELTEGGTAIGAFVLTPDFVVPAETKKRVGEIMLEHGKPFTTAVRFFSLADAALMDFKNALSDGDSKLGATHPAIAELFKLLPSPGSDWPLAEPAKWLQAAEAVFRLGYKSENERRVIIGG